MRRALTPLRGFPFALYSRRQRVSFGDTLQAFDHARRWLRHPVVTFQRPQGHTAQTHIANGAPELRPAISEGRAHQYRGRVALEPEGSKNAVLTSPEFLCDSPCRQKREISMRFGVVADTVSAIGHLAYEIWTGASEATHQEKSRGHSVTPEQGQKLR